MHDRQGLREQLGALLFVYSVYGVLQNSVLELFKLREQLWVALAVHFLVAQEIVYLSAEILVGEIQFLRVALLVAALQSVRDRQQEFSPNHVRVQVVHSVQQLREVEII